MDARVARISISPVKSLGLVHPEEVDLESFGVPGNRRMWLVDDTGRLFNTTRWGPLVQVRQEWDEETRRLALTFPDGSVVDGVVEIGGPVDAVMHRVEHPSRVVVGPWAEALSEYAGVPLTMLWSDEHASDRVSRGGTVTMVSRASLARVAAEGGADEPLDGRRFRMLFEIDGVEAHEEDEWIGGEVRVGDAVVRINGDVGRCVVTTHDPDVGVTDFDTLGVLARYRREGVKEPLPFGVYASVLVPGRVRVGDPVLAGVAVS